MSSRRAHRGRWITEIGLCLIVGSSPSAVAAQAVDTVALAPANGILQEHEGFTRLASVRELADGRVLAVDGPGINALFVIDFTNSSVAQIGRQGEGPGEYDAPGRLYALRGDSTLMTDFVSRRWFILDGPGIVETLRADRSPNRRLGPILSGTDAMGRVLGVEGYLFTHAPVPGPSGMADSLRALLVHGALTDGPPVIDTVGPPLAGKGRFGVRNEYRAPYQIVGSYPLSVEEQALLFPDGWIAFAFVEPYRVDWRRPDGRMQRGQPLPSRTVRVTEEEVCAFVLRTTSRSSCDGVRVPDVVPDVIEVLPPFDNSALLPGPTGDLLVRRMPAADDEFAHYDVVDRAGQLRSVLRLGLNQRIVGFGPRSIYIITVDDVDLQWLTRHPWPSD